MATVTLISPNITEIEEDEPRVTLSPYAPEFYPKQVHYHLCIFNDGVPSLVMASEADVTNLLHGIPDEALDESFPPTAEEAAELDAVEEFVEMMASLAFMEETEERARISFDHVKKRWESRRAQGLQGRPHRAKHSVEPASHGLQQPNNATTKALVGYQHHAQRMLMKHQKLHQKDIEARSKRLGFKSSKLSAAAATKPNRPIQQPRKLN